MKPRRKAEPATRPAEGVASAHHRWLLFVHQLPSTPSNLRVRTWRRLQHLGAVPIKQAVYVLPDSPGAREDFEWLKAEVTGAGGEATVFAAAYVDAWSDDGLVEEFRRARQEAYGALASDVEALLRRLSTKRRRAGTRTPSTGRALDLFRQRLVSIESIDFFGSAGRDRVVVLLGQLAERSGRARKQSGPIVRSSSTGRAAYRGRLWVTRPRPGVDRMASAWLIRRFIDLGARFGFVADRRSVPVEAVPFDMFGVEFSHQGEGCTFETLCTVFGLTDPAVTRVAAIVHDLDLKDRRFGAVEAATVGAVIDGLQLTYEDDEVLLTQGMVLFDSLFRTFERSSGLAGPRKVARAKHPATRR